ncbi:hypothetical protein OGATHE_001937 [Ogataea polymorpha]|uniref:Uncharacterized protein n=1 Tax=Ogataea polymorpha TaxID=460523 RepID=A0A9P8PLA6_9ASCO|nr:hypothetical protein OGATHE_001937 [Ogataea polymorpha]
MSISSINANDDCRTASDQMESPPSSFVPKQYPLALSIIERRLIIEILSSIARTVYWINPKSSIRSAIKVVSLSYFSLKDTTQNLKSSSFSSLLKIFLNIGLLVNSSVCPGQSNIMYVDCPSRLRDIKSLIFSMKYWMLCSNTSKQYTRPPLGPNRIFSSFMISSSVMKSLISIVQWYGKRSFAGSRFTISEFLPIEFKNWFMPLQYVDFPAPGGPITICPYGGMIE